MMVHIADVPVVGPDGKRNLPNRIARTFAIALGDNLLPERWIWDAMLHVPGCPCDESRSLWHPPYFKEVEGSLLKVESDGVYMPGLGGCAFSSLDQCTCDRVGILIFIDPR